MQSAATQRRPNPEATRGTEAIVRLEDVTRRFRTPAGTVTALDGVDLEVPRGTMQGIIGFSGAGKSTLVRCLNALERPDRGRVLIAGHDLATLRGAELRRARGRIGMIYQSFDLLHSRTAAGNVALPLELQGRSRGAIRERVRELLDWVGLAEKGSSHPAQLSGGQKQRVAIARALAAQPDLLLCDEATSALDPETTAAILRLLKRVRDEFGVTVLLVTHEMEAVRSACDRVAVLDAGRIVEEGPVAEVLSRPRSVAARRLLGVDGAGNDASAAPAADAAPADDTLPVEHAVPTDARAVTPAEADAPSRRDAGEVG